ncbi:MAG TPA: dihydrodipicolinate synthase family protein [Desulfatiglandales bacterium]|nr:dihydrodipicolinate synthase family protein [Desulfatiglandales bacterium]
MGFSKAPKGLIVDLVTPINERGDIDGEGLDSLLKKVIPHAGSILLASPHTGEGIDLGLNFKKDLLQKAINSIKGKVPIFFWISEDSAEGTKNALSLMEGFLSDFDYKGPVFWVDSPLFYHSNRGLYGHYLELAGNAKHPIVLYNDPLLVKLLEMPLKRCNIRTNIIKNLSKIGKITALIFRGSLTRANNYHKALNMRSDFRVYDGDETRFLKYPSLSGVVSIGANIAPGIWSAVTRASLGMPEYNQDRGYYPEEIWEMGSTLKRLMQIYSKNPVPIIKKALVELNVIGCPNCIAEHKPFDDSANELAEFISNNDIA